MWANDSIEEVWFSLLMFAIRSLSCSEGLKHHNEKKRKPVPLKVLLPGNREYFLTPLHSGSISFRNGGTRDFCRVSAWLHPIILESIEINDAGSLFFSYPDLALGLWSMCAVFCRPGEGLGGFSSQIITFHLLFGRGQGFHFSPIPFKDKTVILLSRFMILKMSYSIVITDNSSIYNATWNDSRGGRMLQLYF